MFYHSAILLVQCNWFLLIQVSTQNVQSEVTALIIAATANRPGCLHLLLKSGADKDVTDNVRDTVFKLIVRFSQYYFEAQSAGVLLMIRFCIMFSYVFLWMVSVFWNTEGSHCVDLGRMQRQCGMRERTPGGWRRYGCQRPGAWLSFRRYFSFFLLFACCVPVLWVFCTCVSTKSPYLASRFGHAVFLW